MDRVRVGFGVGDGEAKKKADNRQAASKHAAADQRQTGVKNISKTSGGTSEK